MKIYGIIIIDESGSTPCWDLRPYQSETEATKAYQDELKNLAEIEESTKDYDLSDYDIFPHHVISKGAIEVINMSFDEDNFITVALISINL